MTGQTVRSMSGRVRTTALVVPLLLFVQQMMLGSNGPLLAVAAAFSDILAALVVLFLAAPDARFWRQTWPVIAIICAAVCWLCAPALIPTAFLWAPKRPAPDMFLPGIVKVFGNLALLLAGAWIGYRRGLMREALQWILALGIVAIGVGAALRQIDPAHVWGYDKNIMGGRFTGTLLNANSNASLCAVTAILGLTSVLASLRVARGGPVSGSAAIWWFVGLLGCVMGIAACAATGSRTVLSLLAVCLIGLAVGDRALRNAALSWIGAISVATGAVAIAFLTAVAGEMTISRFASFGQDGTGRLEIFSHYWQIVLQSPWIGYGPSSFDEINLHSLGSPVEAMSFWYLHAPHNAAISLMLAGGIPYLGLLVLAFVLMARRAAASQRTDRQDPLLRGAIVSVILIGATSMVDIQLDVPAVFGLTVFLASLIWGRSIRTRADRQSGQLAVDQDDGRAR
ncbi:MAG: O-antigen polymerase [Sphingomonadales bacterium]|nr:O-antigen polymerase [Sphingomonadales bacterium]